jgi:transglutaminase-like putative cysteine protease
MLLKISHTTSYHYESPIDYGLLQLRLTPKAHAGQTIVEWDISVSGGQKQLAFEDQHHNLVTLIGIEPGDHEVFITSQGVVDTADNAGIIGKHGGFAPVWFFDRTTPLTEPGPQIKKLVKALGDDFDDDVGRLHGLSNMIADAMTYETGKTESDTTAEAALEAGHGVCQDHAHVFIAAARLLGFPARYVSGYLMMDDREHQEASHAWAEACLDGVGWVGFDVSNGISPDERYVRVATGLDYNDAAPVRGLRFGEGAETMVVTLQVQQ